MKLKKNTEVIAVNQQENGNRIWIVVADKSIAKVFKKTRDGLEFVCEALPDNVQRAKGEPNNAIGRVQSMGGERHNKLEPHSELGRRDAMSFAHELSDWLEESIRKNEVDRIILAAAPRTLGDVRNYLSKAVQERIAHEIDKELTKHSEDGLLEVLKDYL